MVLTNMLKEVVDPAFHYGIRGLANKGFGTTPPVDILANLQHLYGKSSYQELDAALLRLNQLMNQMQMVKVVIRVIEEVPLLLLANPNKDCTLAYPNLICYALIKLTKTGGIYSKGIERWQKRPPQDCQQWDELSVHIVKYYKRQLTKMGGATMGQEGYGTAMHAAEYLSDEYSLT